MRLRRCAYFVARLWAITWIAGGVIAEQPVLVEQVTDVPRSALNVPEVVVQALHDGDIYFIKAALNVRVVSGLLLRLVPLNVLTALSESPLHVRVVRPDTQFVGKILRDRGRLPLRVDIGLLNPPPVILCPIF